jgi:hypothetical protein
MLYCVPLTSIWQIAACGAVRSSAIASSAVFPGLYAAANPGGQFAGRPAPVASEQSASRDVAVQFSAPTDYKIF